MASNENWEAIEKAAGSKAASQLQSAVLTVTGSTFRKRTGELSKSTVRARYDRSGHLDRLVLSSPRYSFILHHGYSEPDESVKGTTRAPGFVQAHERNGKAVGSYMRGGSSVSAYRRNISAKGEGHIAEALNSSNILDTLADSLAGSRAVEIISKLPL